MRKKDKLSREDILRIEVEEIKKHKWMMSEKRGQDVGEEAVKDWIERYAADFREYWEKKLEEKENE